MLEAATHFYVGDDDPTDRVVRAMGDHSESEAFERRLSTPTSQGPQFGEPTGTRLAHDGSEQGACNTPAP